MSLVEVKNLSISFGSFTAVDDISFTVEPGARFGVIGESGSGKTLTALAIAGLLPEAARTKGDILIAGTLLPEGEVEMSALRGNKIGMVFQEPMTALNPLMRAGDQVGEAVRLHVSQHDVDARVQPLFEEAGLETHHMERYPHQLSGGQRQRVMIAIALAGEPELLICDEPTSALDLITQRRILALLDEICTRRNMALIFISHDLRAVAHLCPHVMVMHDGNKVEMGTREAVFGAPTQHYTQQLIAAAEMDVRTSRELISDAPLFVAENLSRVFTRRGALPFIKTDPLIAVNAVSFQIGVGESVALVGPSGCGKSTLARLIAGLDRADSGHMVLDRQTYGQGRKMVPALRRKISLVFQDPLGSFDPRQSIGNAIAEPLRLLPELNGEEKSIRVREAVEEVGLEADALDRYPHAFSGGQRQRLAIARALVTRPELVVLDEPVSALDVSLRGDVLDLLSHLRTTHGLAYLIISHDLDMVRAVADRVLVMQAGKIVERGTPETLFNAPESAIAQELIAARLPALPS